MDVRFYDYWVATLQNGYIGNLVAITEAAGGAKSLYELISRHRMGADISKACGMIRDSNNRIMLTEALRNYMAKLWKSEDDIEHDFYKMMSNDIVCVNHSDEEFPTKLLNIPSPPYGLFLKGQLPDENKKSVAIVGARECSEYGRTCAEYFGDRLAREGIQIISGMAWGIDGLSQLAAIKAGGNSFGVLGCGVDVPYPRKNANLYSMLCRDGNGVMSEYAPGTEAQPRFFPPRNRIISGLCDVLLVVEAKAKSGTFITVNMAIEQGKSIMAVPGRITDELSRGCLMLTREGAMPAISVDSILEELDLADSAEEGFVQMELDLIDDLSETERVILNIISYEPLSAGEVSKKCKINISNVLITLSKLELKGYVKEVGQGEFVKGKKLTLIN